MIENILSPTHLLLILVVALIVLGPKRLPEAGRGLGSAIRGFKDSLSTAELRERPARDPAVARARSHARRIEGAIRMEAFPLRAVAHDERLTLTEHLSELRVRLLFSVAVLTVLFAGCLWQSRSLLHVLNVPLAQLRASSRGGALPTASCPKRWRAAPVLSPGSRTPPPSPRSTSGPRWTRPAPSPSPAGRSRAPTPARRSRSGSASRSPPRSPSPSPSRCSSDCRSC